MHAIDGLFRAQAFSCDLSLVHMCSLHSSKHVALPSLLAHTNRPCPSSLCVSAVADDWYVLDSEPNSFVLVVYRGSNDAWDGYGGGTLYTKVHVPCRVIHALELDPRVSCVPVLRGTVFFSGGVALANSNRVDSENTLLYVALAGK